MAERPGPTLRRRKLAKELIAAREAAGLSVRQLAAEIGLQHGTVSKIENAKQAIRPINIRAIGRATGLSKSKIDSLVLLAADDDTRDDWLLEFREGMPDWFSWFSAYTTLERDAQEIWTYTSELVDGLLQTPAYATELARCGYPDISEGQLQRSVELRRARQSLLDEDDAPRLHLIFNEAVVRRPVGGWEVMREQITHLIEMAKRPNITLQVLPFEVGAHPGMKSPFTLLRFPEGFDDMDCVYLENVVGGVWQERSSDIAEHVRVFQHMSRLALSVEDTAQLLYNLVSSESQNK
ncbi:helix-turn-helix domain-containing protein [Goodfellowiella coeruleoviolacea]|uniref:Helix-turn-helix protein n=1 Tax=Goodfellowiella coeruleoviolacea TaxID=334858 RepID=A0AAE3GK78_9PSEU|nr:helix-turn-helix transcriptional regulator [Goodfellowiella coeruleoviolacea]MCP2169705.1 helix-turn-helix protein [Goodfellowiella coeruleoviolacea]